MAVAACAGAVTRQAINGLIGVGVQQDWATHMIGHELTAFTGLDHAQTLAIVLPALLKHQRAVKRAKLLQYADRVWNLRDGDAEARISAAIDKTEVFFRAVGVKTRLNDYGIDAAAAASLADRIAARFTERGTVLGEAQDLTPAAVATIVRASA